MKKGALVFVFLCLLTFCACNKEPSNLTTRAPQNYEFQTSAPSTTEVPTTKLPEVGNTIGTQIYYTNVNIWSDFEDVQRYDNTPINTTIEKSDVTVFNYPLQTVLAYFSEIAFGDEGDAALGVARKWIKPIYYEIYGTADEVDVAVIRWASEYLNGINGFPGMFAATATNKANVKFYFGNLTFMQSALGVTDNTLQSCTRLFYNADDYRIQLAKVGIVTDTTSRTARNSLILEEILQMIGLNQNSLNYPQSLFYKANALPQVPDELDLTLVRLLYSPAITGGMNKADGVTAAADVLVSRYESGVIYTEPKVDFTMLALEYAITTVTELPTEEPTTDPYEEDPTEDYYEDPTEEDEYPPVDYPSEEDTDEPTTVERPTGSIVIPTGQPTTEPSPSNNNNNTDNNNNQNPTDPPEPVRPTTEPTGNYVPPIEFD